MTGIAVSLLRDAPPEAVGGDRRLLDALPAAVYTTDATGLVTYYNRAAAELAGREPQLGQDQWCITWRLCRPDGTPLPHDQCPMAVALK
jgi:PAS domain-containing protein